MVDTHIHDISEETGLLISCPVLHWDEERDDWMACLQPLNVLHSRTVRGDDYGSWPEHDVYFQCGHTLAQMRDSLKHEEI